MYSICYTRCSWHRNLQNIQIRILQIFVLILLNDYATNSLRQVRKEYYIRIWKRLRDFAVIHPRYFWSSKKIITKDLENSDSNIWRLWCREQVISIWMILSHRHNVLLFVRSRLVVKHLVLSNRVLIWCATVSGVLYHRALWVFWPILGALVRLFQTASLGMEDYMCPNIPCPSPLLGKWNV